MTLLELARTQKWRYLRGWLGALTLDVGREGSVNVFQPLISNIQLDYFRWGLKSSLKLLERIVIWRIIWYENTLIERRSYENSSYKPFGATTCFFSSIWLNLSLFFFFFCSVDKVHTHTRLNEHVHEKIRPPQKPPSGFISTTFQHAHSKWREGGPRRHTPLWG